MKLIFKILRIMSVVKLIYLNSMIKVFQLLQIHILVLILVQIVI